MCMLLAGNMSVFLDTKVYSPLVSMAFVTESKPEKEVSTSNDDELRAWPPRSSSASGEVTATVKKGQIF